MDKEKILEIINACEELVLSPNVSELAKKGYITQIYELKRELKTLKEDE